MAQDGLPPHPPLDPSPNAGRSEKLDALAAYVASLTRAPPSPHRELDDSLSPAASRGRKLFYDDALGCASCHIPPRFTDSVLTSDPNDFVLHDVGTLGEGSGQRLGGPLTGLDTPTLIGLWASAPYLHDGSATLREVLVERNVGDAHGQTSQLDAAQLDDLVAFLLALDGSPDELPDDEGGETGAEDASATDDDAGSTGADTASGPEAGGPALMDPGSGCGSATTPSRTPGLATVFSLSVFHSSTAPRRPDHTSPSP